jgi:IS30 family transposase
MIKQVELDAVFPGRLPAVTYDNGLENASHDKINEALGTKSYFCKPYHRGEKAA